MHKIHGPVTVHRNIVDMTNNLYYRHWPLKTGTYSVYIIFICKHIISINFVFNVYTLVILKYLKFNKKMNYYFVENWSIQENLNTIKYKNI